VSNGKAETKPHFDFVIRMKTSNGPYEARALLDSGAEMNFVSQMLVKEKGWAHTGGGPVEIHTFDGDKRQSYGTVQIDCTFTDSQGTEKGGNTTFCAADLAHYDVILGFPWLLTWNPHVDWSEQSWRYTREDLPVAIVDPRDLANDLVNGVMAYALFYRGSIDPETTRNDDGSKPRLPKIGQNMPTFSHKRTPGDCHLQVAWSTP